jgi:hypothetical protein
MKELEEQKYTYNEIAMKEAREAMDIESKKLVIENRRINEELKFHNVISYEFQLEKDKLESALVTAKREVVLLTEKEKEYAKQNYLKTKEIKALRERSVFYLLVERRGEREGGGERSTLHQCLIMFTEWSSWRPLNW